MRKAYKYRLYPTKEQADKLTNSLDLLRELYNAAVQERRDAWQMNRKSITYFDQSRQIPAIREARPEFMGVHSRAIAQTLRQTDKTFKAFYRRCKAGERPGFPRFKTAMFFNSFHYNQKGFRFIGKKLNLTFIGSLKIRLHRPYEGTLKEITVKREGSKWFAILSCTDVPLRPLPDSPHIVGIDVGIESFASLSDGIQIPNWKFYESASRQLRIAQRRVARRKKGSNGRRRAVTDLSVRWHQCSSCGLSEHRDIVSAKVILDHAVGQTVQASTWGVSPCVA